MKEMYENKIVETEDKWKLESKKLKDELKYMEKQLRMMVKQNEELSGKVE